MSPSDVPSPPSPGDPLGDSGEGSEGGFGFRYRFRIRTGSGWGAGTPSGVTLRLRGTLGEAPERNLRWPRYRFWPNGEVVAEVTSQRPLGPLVALRVRKEPLGPERWHCHSVTVTPLGQTGSTGSGGNEDTGSTGSTGSGGLEEAEATFPCHRWLGGGDVLLREGTGRTPQEAARIPELLEQREEERRERREQFQWAPYAPGWPWRLRALPPTLCPWPAVTSSVTSSAPEVTSSSNPEQQEVTSPLSPEVTSPLSPDLAFPLAHRAGIAARVAAAQLRIRIRGLTSGDSWGDFGDLRAALGAPGTPISDYVVQHWQDEAFFGGQYLGGVNPLLLRRCSRLPPNFPVTPKMVAPALPPHSTLGTEMEAGNVYLADYGVLEGLPTAQLDGNPTFLAAPLVLLHLQPGGDLVPIAIQLSQHPGPSTPIFLPGDPPWVWALAKVWVRSAEFQVHEGLTHLLRCHLLGEVYALATLRNLPPQHPLYKLLIPHMRFTVHIATLARKFLLNPGGVFDSAVALGRRGLLQLVARGLRSLSYSSLVVPRDLRRRGVTRIPGYHYAHDALRIWRAIHSYVRGVLGLYYPGDSAVRGDPELQAWVGEIFKKGFLGRRRSGVPSSLTSLPEAAIFVTMVIYSCSALHAATNSGQFELGAFIPNMPAAMREPPLQSKEPLGEEDFLRALPAMNTSAITLGVLWVLRNEPFDMRALGCYPENHFTEEAPRALIRRFRRRLAAISRSIQRRNQGLALPYPYLDPRNIENSVAI